MEIDNLKKAWQETIDSREKNTEINYLVLKKLTLETTSSSINKILNFQKIGTFLALLYAIISFALGFIFLTTYYCVPLFISGILMVYCFWGHYKNNKMIENIDYYKTPVKDYLKTVLQYENKIYEAKKSDYIITFFLGYSDFAFIYKIC
jgi:fatty acid desaturase